jgi:hypothetical protein
MELAQIPVPARRGTCGECGCNPGSRIRCLDIGRPRQWRERGHLEPDFFSDLLAGFVSLEGAPVARAMRTVMVMVIAIAGIFVALAVAVGN